MIRKVYLVLWWFADAGGMEQHVVNLGRALVRQGVEVEVFSQMPVHRRSHYLHQLREAKIPLHSPPGWTRRIAHSKDLRKNVRRIFWLLLSPPILAQRLWRKIRGGPIPHQDMTDQVNNIVFFDFSRWLARRTLDRRHRKAPADLVHVHGFRLDHVWALRWARSRRIPSMYTEHGTISDWDGLWENDAAEGVRHADIIACVSKRSRESLYKFIPKETSVRIVPHIVDDPAAAAAGNGSNRDMDGSSPVRLTCVARLQQEKGGVSLVRAMRRVADRLPETRLALAGDGPDREALRELAASLGLEENIIFRGRFAPRDLPLLMEETDIVVLPSLTEGLPLTLLEAMAFAKPIVATRVGGIPELIRHGENGLLVEPGDEEALADALLRLAGDRSMRERFGAVGRRDFVAGGFGEKAVVSETLGMYEEARAFCDSRRKDEPCGS